MNKGTIMLIWGLLTCIIIAIFIFLNHQANEPTSMKSGPIEQGEHTAAKISKMMAQKV
ncbi:hypothetical protein ACFOU2_17365 [Bacillus songklensis]|uniref:Uncharacterized protein n=1 Tax=Bacillus songklensis TaxID=1069116 RepID=A0ABV8B7I6_9BACI